MALPVVDTEKEHTERTFKGKGLDEAIAGLAGSSPNPCLISELPMKNNSKTATGDSSRKPKRRKPLSESLLYWLLGGVVAIFLLYWLAAAFVLLPASRLPATDGRMTGASDTNGPAGVAARDAPWPVRWRDELATTDERLTGPRGTFGDMFGAVNALFSGLAFACIFYSLLQQREDLRLQREELEETRGIATVAARLQGQATLASSLIGAIQIAGLQPELKTRLENHLDEIEKAVDELKQKEKADREGCTETSDTTEPTRE
jgi:hypothetical protein